MLPGAYGIGGRSDEPFDTLAATATANTTLPVGWYLEESGSSSLNNDAYSARHWKPVLV